MPRSSLPEKLLDVAVRGEKFLDSCTQLNREVVVRAPLSLQQKGVLLGLFAACNRASESAILVTKYGNPFDGDIILRSVIEGTSKFAYLVHKSEGLVGRFEEYSQTSVDFGWIRTSERAAKSIAKVPENAEHVSSIRRVVLPVAALSDLRSRYPRGGPKKTFGKMDFHENSG